MPHRVRNTPWPSRAAIINTGSKQIEGGDSDFYVICPDDTVSSELDAARILWSGGDMTENRPALSR